MKIPFVDLKAQYKTIKKEIDAAIKNVITDCVFVGTSNNKYVQEFEQAFGKFSGLKYIVACANGTDAIEIALKALGIGVGDEVLVPALTWISTAEAVSSIGAKPVFVDIDEYYGIDSKKIEAKINKKTKAIIAVHLYGQPADMISIAKIAKKHHLKILEDCAQAHGAELNGKKVGTFGDIATFSFFPGKNLGAYGDAGAIATNSKTLADTCRKIGQHGQLDKKHYHYIEGRNSRLDGIQAAVLSVKLKYLDKWTKARIKNADTYRQLLDNVELPKVRPGAKHVYHLFVIQTEVRDKIQIYLKAQGIETAIHYPTALPFLACYKDRGHKPSDFPVAYAATEKILSLPMFAELDLAQMKFAAKAIKKHTS